MHVCAWVHETILLPACLPVCLLQCCMEMISEPFLWRLPALLACSYLHRTYTRLLSPSPSLALWQSLSCSIKMMQSNRIREAEIICKPSYTVPPAPPLINSFSVQNAFRTSPLFLCHNWLSWNSFIAADFEMFLHLKVFTGYRKKWWRTKDTKWNWYWEFNKFPQWMMQEIKKKITGIKFDDHYF